MYSNFILNRFQNLHNVGKILNATISADVEDKNTNSLLRVYLNVENNIITLAKFKCFGNVLTTVCADVLCDNLVNKNIEDITSIGVGEILSFLGEVNDINAIEFVLSVINQLVKEYNKKLEKENKHKNR